MNAIWIAIALSSITGPLAAQWLNYPTPGIPRTADGKPNLSAPAPRTPDGKADLSGLWGMDGGKYLGNIAAELKPGDLQPWAEALFKQRAADLGGARSAAASGAHLQAVARRARDIDPAPGSKVRATFIKIGELSSTATH